MIGAILQWKDYSGEESFQLYWCSILWKDSYVRYLVILHILPPPPHVSIYNEDKIPTIKQENA